MRFSLDSARGSPSASPVPEPGTLGLMATGLVGAAVTNTCAMGVALSKMPWNRTPASTDIGTVIRSLQPAAA